MALSLSLGEPHPFRFGLVFSLPFNACCRTPPKPKRVPNDIDGNIDGTRGRRVAREERALVHEKPVLAGYLRWDLPGSGLLLGSGLIARNDCCRESDGREEDLWASVIAWCHSSPVLEATEHALDAIAALVSLLVVFDLCLAGRPGRDARVKSPICQCVPEPIRIVAPVGEQPVGIRQGAKLGRGARVVTPSAMTDRSVQGDTDAKHLEDHGRGSCCDVHRTVGAGFRRWD